VLQKRELSAWAGCMCVRYLSLVVIACFFLCVFLALVSPPFQVQFSSTRKVFFSGAAVHGPGGGISPPPMLRQLGMC